MGDSMLQVIPTPKEHDAIENNWRSTIEVGDEFATHCEELLDALSPFKSMWNGHLGHFKANSYKSKLNADFRPIFQPPSRAGQMQRKLV